MMLRPASCSKVRNVYRGCLCDISPVDQPFDYLLEKMEGEHQQAKSKSFPHRGDQKRLVLVSFSQLAYSPIIMTLVMTSALISANAIVQYWTLYSLSRSMS